MPERIESMIALFSSPDHPHFLEIDAHCRQIFRDIADVLVLVCGRTGSLPPIAGERGDDNLFGSRRSRRLA
jgi:hypothetical protein